MAGRPTTYNLEIAAQICDLIEDGSNLKAACAIVGTTHKTFYNWIDTHPELLTAYERACAIRADNEVDSIHEIYSAIDPKVENAAAHINLARLKIDSIKWTAGKHRPKKYNDKLMVVGGNGEGPVEFVIRDMTKKE